MSVHNGLPYLPQAIESVLSQTFVDFEFLIIDDASTDASVACVRAYADPRIRLVCNQDNLGQTQSLNRGLELARGRYIARLDADDMCLPTRLEKQTEVVRKRPELALLGTWMYSIAPDGRRMALISRAWEDRGTYLAWLLMEICPLWHPTVMFRRDVVTEAGGYDESFRIAQDYDLWIRLALRGHCGSVLTEPLVLCRHHPERQTVANAALHRRETRSAHTRMIEAGWPQGGTMGLSQLLRGDDAFWSFCHSKAEMVGTFHALAGMLHYIRHRLELSDEEFANLEGLLYRRLGAGVRLGEKFAAWPSPLFYAGVFALSPLLIPGLRRKLRRVRDALHLLLSHSP
jgi:glycosyltransferase involved in cell wall biosynthesis